MRADAEVAVAGRRSHDGTSDVGRHPPSTPVGLLDPIPRAHPSGGPGRTGTPARQSCRGAYFFLGGTVQITDAVLPAASVAVTRASPLRVICQATAPEKGTAVGVAPGAWVSFT